VISFACSEHRVGGVFAHLNAISNCLRACDNAGDRRVVSDFDGYALCREFMKGNDVRSADRRSFR
jgi:hypothetical protein